MKPIKLHILVLLLFCAITACQHDLVVEELNPYNSLIGKEYSDISELDGLEFRTKMVESGKNGVKINHVLQKGSTWLFTSETYNKQKEMNVIQDVLVFEKRFSSCGRCLFSEEHNNLIISFHPFMEINKNSILEAYEVEPVTGKFKKVDPNTLVGNTHFLNESENIIPIAPNPK